jgi:predicted ATPase
MKREHEMDPEVAAIRHKMLNQPWPQYLRNLRISGLRGWTGQEVRFDFPVTVLAGENGSGKSTVLKVAATAYRNQHDATRSFNPSTFFPDTAWEQSANVILSYSIRQGQNETTHTVTKPTQRWRRLGQRPHRNVIWQDISRTQPLETTVGYARIAKRTAVETASDNLNQQFRQRFSSILGRQYQQARMALADVDATRRVGVVQFGGQQFSQFHQGAGEDASLDLIALCQNVPANSLILIDEVEASLHPKSQRRLIHFLLWLARTRNIQVIVSTHSSYVLEELPLEARVFLSRGAGGIAVLYGVSSDFALNRMDDPVHPELFILTEDREAGLLVTEMLRHGNVDLTGIRFTDVGPANVVRTLGALVDQNSLPFRAVCVLDADQAVAPGCVLLPGNQPPERQVFQDILDHAIVHLANRLEISEAATTDALEHAIAQVDHHGWIQDAANTLNQTPQYLWITMSRVWARECCTANQIASIVQPVQAALQA